MKSLFLNDKHCGGVFPKIDGVLSVARPATAKEQGRQVVYRKRYPILPDAVDFDVYGAWEPDDEKGPYRLEIVFIVRSIEVMNELRTRLAKVLEIDKQAAVQSRWRRPAVRSARLRSGHPRRA